jgi:uncharacterized protein (TIGR02118 family)
MIVRMGLLTKRADLTSEQFRRHWREAHGPLAAKLPGLIAYHQNHVIDKSQLGIDHARGNADLDGISQLWFSDRASMEAAIASPAYAAVAADSDNAIAATRLIVCEPNVVVAPESGPPLKRMSLLTRRKDLTAADFRHEWFDKHAEKVKKFPKLAGYVQNLVLDRLDATPLRGPDSDAPVDGVVEMWFREKTDLEAAFRSPAAEVSQRHALDFIDTITTFLVEVHEVV